MSADLNFHIPDCEAFRNGYTAYQREPKGPIYFEALSTVSNGWGKPEDMAEGVGIIIRGWNYLFSNYDNRKLIQCIERNMKSIQELRHRKLRSLSKADDKVIQGLFEQFLEALKRIVDSRRSAVSVAKAFGVLTPEFLPIWDNPIADAYGHILDSDIAHLQYADFCHQMKYLADKVRTCVPYPDDRSLLKRIDEYNYAKYTQGWI
jgi:hypothetical protein